MKTIGLIGGISWESSAQYYRLINEGIKQRLGGLHSAKLILYSLEFHEIEKLQSSGDWHEAGAILAQAAIALEKAGADFLLIAANTMHKVADVVEKAVKIPLLHIGDPTGESIVKYGFKSVGLLGTTYTMEQNFYKDRLQNKYGLEVLVPGKKDGEEISRIVYEELCLGKIKTESRQFYIAVINELIARGAECIILACTEMMLLINEEDILVSMFDTTSIHADAAVEMSLSSDTVLTG